MLFRSVGSAMCSHVRTERGTVLDRTSIFPLTVEEENSEVVKQKKALFEERLAAKLKDRIKGIKDGKDPDELERREQDEAEKELQVADTPLWESDDEWNPLSMDPALLAELKEEDRPQEIKEADDFTEDMQLDRYVGAKVMLPTQGHTFATGTVIKRARDKEGMLIGKDNANPLLDSAVYEVQREDGAVERYHANIIAENIYARIDQDGHSIYLLDEILDHKKDDTAIPVSDGLDRKGKAEEDNKRLEAVD